MENTGRETPTACHRALGHRVYWGAGLEKCSAISSPVLLTIDDSDPSAVVITATGFAPAVNSGKFASSGVDLLTFFRTGQTGLLGSSFNTTLFGGGSPSPYSDVRSDNFSTSGGSSVDLNLFIVTGSGDLQGFTTTQPAFTGSWTIDLSGLGVSAPDLPTSGTTGDILTGFSGDQGAIIGQWEVGPVPEPGVGSLLVLGSIIGLIVRGRAARRM